MTDMKCPICGQELKNINFMWFCENESCRAYDWTMEESAWQELIRTRKALDIARNGLEYIFGYEDVPEYVVKHIRQVLDQIKNETALEQKDK